MASAKVGVNFVRIFFYKNDRISPERRQALVALAYATARTLTFAPKAILVRADVHQTTFMNGKWMKDPRGWHGTFAFKDGKQLEQQLHVASHGYTTGRESFALVESTHGSEKPDDTPRGPKPSEKVVWPEEEDLLEYKESPIGYSHLAEDAAG